MSYTIGEIAKKTGLPTSTIRWYEKEGLLFDIDRNKNGLRIFTDKDIEMIEVVICLKNTGMSIHLIKQYIDLFRHGPETYSTRVKLFQLQKERLESQIASLQEQLAAANYKIWYYQNVEEIGDPADPENCAKMRSYYEEHIRR